tara:strand:- start:7425 stop:8309 length:885 start_codon:yes stop_codon:yes gene_type:complete
MKHFIDISDYTKKELNFIINLSKKIKAKPKLFSNKCKNKTLGLIFKKSSTRTRLSFTVGFQKMGGRVIELNENDIGFGKRETAEDIITTLSQYIEILMIRNNDHKLLRKLSLLNKIPIINGLTEYSHPCQILSDLLTINETIGKIENNTITWVGDYNNVLRSLIHLQNLYSFKLNIILPKRILRDNKLKIFDKNIKNVIVTDNIEEGVKKSNCIMTDTWVSMGEKTNKKKYFLNYQVNSQIMKYAMKDAIFMHCLPANRGQEVSSELLDSKKSVVWLQAKNRMFVQQAIILNLL